MKKLSTEEFIRRSILKHGNVYDYSKTVYVDSTTKVVIECNKHGEFIQLPHSHINVSGCPKCTKERKQKTTEQFVAEATKVHDGLYDYSKTVYVRSKEKVIIGCKKHGDFLQSPNPHLKGHGCPNCKKEVLSQRYSGNLETFIERAEIIHDFKYSYENAVYVTNKIDIEIICPVHGVFLQRPDAHLSGKGCATCNLSQGVRKVTRCLNKNNYNIIFEKKFSDCVNKLPLPFDIFIESLNLCIEYDGRQHFEPIKAWGGESNLEYIRNNDAIKTNYCLENNINLLRIRYDEDHTSVLKKYFKNKFNIDIKE